MLGLLGDAGSLQPSCKKLRSTHCSFPQTIQQRLGPEHFRAETFILDFGRGHCEPMSQIILGRSFKDSLAEHHATSASSESARLLVVELATACRAVICSHLSPSSDGMMFSGVSMTLTSAPYLCHPPFSARKVLEKKAGIKGHFPILGFFNSKAIFQQAALAAGFKHTASNLCAPT